VRETPVAIKGMKISTTTQLQTFAGWLSRGKGRYRLCLSRRWFN